MTCVFCVCYLCVVICVLRLFLFVFFHVVVFFSLEIVLEKFKRHLTSLSGGEKADQEVKKSVRMVRKVLLESKIEDVFSFCEIDSLDDVEEFFIQANLNAGKNPSTIRNHLSALTAFADFIFLKSLNPKFGHTQVTRIKSYRLTWNKVLNKRINQQATEKFEKDQDVMANPLDYQTYLESNVSKWCNDILDGKVPADGKTLGVKAILELRDHLATCISFTNAARASGVTGIQISHFENAKYWEDTDNYTIVVPRHKNSKTKHAAHIGVSPQLYKRMGRFLVLFKQNLKSRGKKTRGDAFFMTRNGNPMASNSMCKSISRMMRKSGYTGPINNTVIRKMTTTAVISVLT